MLINRNNYYISVVSHSNNFLSVPNIIIWSSLLSGKRLARLSYVGCQCCSLLGRSYHTVLKVSKGEKKKKSIKSQIWKVHLLGTYQQERTPVTFAPWLQSLLLTVAVSVQKVSYSAFSPVKRLPHCHLARGEWCTFFFSLNLQNHPGLYSWGFYIMVSVFMC